MTRRRALGICCLACCILPWLSGPLCAADGDLDPSFSGGKVMLDWTQWQDQATALSPLAGGRLLVAGFVWYVLDWAITELLPDGTVDPAWAANAAPFGFPEASGEGTIFDVRRDASGRTWAAGMMQLLDPPSPNPDRPRPALARLLSTGALDPDFGDDGRMLLLNSFPSGWNLTHVNDAKLLPDGRSVFVGSCLDCPEAGDSGAFVLRLTADGVPDAAFSGDGWEAFSPDPSCLVTRGEAVFVSKAAVVTVAGSCQSVITTLTAVTFVARLTAAGLLDSGFGGGDGISALLDLTPRRPRDIAISPSTGKIVLAMASPSEIASGGLLGLTATGAPDDDFATAGFLDLDLEEGTRMDAVQFQSDGKIVAAGTINANGAQIAGFLLARTLANGTLDPSYDANGVKRVEFDRAPNAYDRAHALALSSGRLVVGGLALGGSGSGVVALVRTGNTQILHSGFELGTLDEWAEE